MIFKFKKKKISEAIRQGNQLELVKKKSASCLMTLNKHITFTHAKCVMVDWLGLLSEQA